VHALLGALTERKTPGLKKNDTINATRLWHTVQALATDKKHGLSKHWIFKDQVPMQNQRCLQDQ
jgi:hypothetical protein